MVPILHIIATQLVFLIVLEDVLSLTFASFITTLLCHFPFVYSHSAGDVLMMKPQNIASAVDEFIELMKLDPEQKFTLEQNDEGTCT